MALANVAWIAASKGYRVLAVDWDLESPGLHRYFHPFLLDKQLRSSRGVIDMIREFAAATLDRSPSADDDPLWLSQYAEVFQYAISLNWDFPAGGRLDLLPPGQQDPSYTKAVSTFDWDTFYERQNGGAFLDALRENMRRHYDYVLIDSRTGLSDAAGICTIHLPDMVVDCFTMSDQSIEGAAAVARSIVNQRETSEPIRIVPVPMRVEDAEQFKLEAGRDIARLRFGPFLTDLSAEEVEAYWGDVEIPYKPFYAYEEILAPFGDRPKLENSLLAAFERLARILTDGAVQTTGQLPDADRRHWLAEFERTRPVPGNDVAISYATVDRVWADWISAELKNAGVTVRLQAVDAAVGPGVPADLERGLAGAGQVLILLSQGYAAATYAVDLWKTVSCRDFANRPRSMVPVRIDSVRLSAPFIERAPVDLAGLSPDRAHDTLLNAVGVTPASWGERSDADAPRFPGTPPPVWNVPPRGTAFVGRGRTLEELRDRLSGTPTATLPQTLYGLGGVGKSQLAIEYAHRFAGDYDLVWWVNAEDAGRIRSGLADLATQLRLPPADAVQKAAAALDALRQGRPHPRWLIILDNADSPDQLDGLLPQGIGHVLITTRNQLWTKNTPALELGVFDRDESILLLQNRVPGLSESEADRVAEKLGDLPLAIEQAAAWLTLTAMPVDQYLDLLDTPQMIRILSENQPPNYPRSAVATWLLSLRRLREHSPAAAGLLEICSFLASEEIPVSLFTGDRFTQLITRYDSTLRDPILQSLVIREIGRYALAKVDARNNSVKIHRLVQATIRDQIDPAHRDEVRRNAQDLLVAASPHNPDKSENWLRYAELLPHLTPAGMVDATNPESRQLIVDMVRFLNQRGDSVSSRQLADKALSHWRAAGIHEDDEIMLMLRFNQANAQRALVDYDAARQADEDVHERLTRLRGKSHPYTLMTARSLGADLRAVINV
jgi:hypothetical protein